MPDRPRKDDPALGVPERARSGWTAVDPEALARETERQRRRKQSRRRMLLGVTIAGIVVLVLAIGGVSATILTALSQRSAAGVAAAATSTPTPTGLTFPDDQPAAAAGAAPCIPVSVMSSYENAEMVANLAAAYNAQPRDIRGSCVTVTTAREKSGVAAQDAATAFSAMPADQRPTIWLPDAHTWMAEAAAEGATLRTDRRSIGSSDIVLAMPQSLADAIGWTQDPPSWQDVFNAAGDPNLWSKLGHPEWGAFKLGKTSPIVATSGQAAMFASYGMSAGTLTALTTADVSNPAVAAEVQKHELSTSHYMATPEHFLWHARQAEESGSAADFLSAVIVDEKSVWDYNRGITSRDGVNRVQSDPPREPLVPIYPSDGFYVADNPAVVLTGDWVTPPMSAAAEDFVRYAGTAQGQQIVRQSGYRDLNGQLDSGVTATGLLEAHAEGVLPFPEWNVVSAVNAAFPEVRKRAQVLFLVDASGSMNDPIGNGQTKMDAAKDAIAAALGYFTPGDNVGLAAFADVDGQTVPGVLSPVADLGTNRDQVNAALSELTATETGDTPLYDAVDSFAQQQAAAYAPDRINAIVLLSDGKNDMDRPTTTVEQMTADLENLHHNGTPVLVFTLAYGADADVATLQSISSTTGAHYYDATDPSTLKSVLGDLVTSF